jgi:hypothetical protein
MAITIQVKIRCNKHPRYKGTAKPQGKSFCDTCDALWAARHDPERFADNTFFSDSRVEIIDLTDDDERTR